jgi:hypothetical protein
MGLLIAPLLLAEGQPRLVILGAAVLFISALRTERNRQDLDAKLTGLTYTVHAALHNDESKKLLESLSAYGSDGYQIPGPHAVTGAVVFAVDPAAVAPLWSLEFRETIDVLIERNIVRRGGHYAHTSYGATADIIRARTTFTHAFESPVRASICASETGAFACQFSMDASELTMDELTAWWYYNSLRLSILALGEIGATGKARMHASFDGSEVGRIADGRLTSWRDLRQVLRLQRPRRPRVRVYDVEIDLGTSKPDGLESFAKREAARLARQVRAALLREQAGVRVPPHFFRQYGLPVIDGVDENWNPEVVIMDQNLHLGRRQRSAST